MLHNHLRNFTSHKLAIDLDAADQADHRANGVDQLRGRVEVAGYHTRSLVDTGKAVALCKGRRCSQKQGCREKKMFLIHKLFSDCAGRLDRPPGGLILIFYSVDLVVCIFRGAATRTLFLSSFVTFF